MDHRLETLSPPILKSALPFKVAGQLEGNRSFVPYTFQEFFKVITDQYSFDHKTLWVI